MSSVETRNGCENRLSKSLSVSYPVEVMHGIREIAKGRGFIYACDGQLYTQVKTKGDTVYLKCQVEHCDGSAKLKNGMFSLA